MKKTNFSHFYNDINNKQFHESIIKIVTRKYIMQDKTIYKVSHIHESNIQKVLVVSNYVSFFISYDMKTSQKFAVVLNNTDYNLLCTADDYTIKNVVEACEDYLQYIIDYADNYTKVFFVEVKTTNDTAYNEDLHNNFKDCIIDSVKFFV